MATSQRKNDKLVQVVQNFFSKAAHIIVGSRIDGSTTMSQGSSYLNTSGSSRGKVNKWFNLHLDDFDLPKEDLKPWKANLNVSTMSPMIIETYLDLRDLTSRQTLVLKDNDDITWTVAKGTKKTEVVLERWLIEFDSTQTKNDDELPLIYKQAVILFRCLYTYTRLLPTYKLKRRLSKAKLNISPLRIGTKILDGNHPISSKGRIGLSRPIIEDVSGGHMDQREFESVATSLGSLKISVAYRKQHNFYINDNEELLSNHFLSLDNKINDDEDAESDTSHTDTTEKEEISASKQPFAQPGSLRRFSLQSQQSVSPSGSPYLRDVSPVRRRLSSNTSGIRPAIQPFKVGSVTSSSPVSSSLERKVSITSNRSTSNASLAALLRNPRGSGSSNNVNISATPTNTGSGTSTAVSPVTMLHRTNSNSNHEPMIIPNKSHESGYPVFSSGSSGAPKFSSSFSSRTNRRNSSLIQKDNASLLSTSDNNSSDPFSGLYVDEDIGNFVKMIDSKADLRLSSSPHSTNSMDVLNKFQSLKNQHQQLGESVSASLILNHPMGPILGGAGTSRSRRSSNLRSGSLSQSPQPRVRPPSQSQSPDMNLPSIPSILERVDTPSSIGGSNVAPDSLYGITSGSGSSQRVFNKNVENKQPEKKNCPAPRQQEIKYEDVFEDDDEDDIYTTRNSIKQNVVKGAHGGSRGDEDEDDDLLFAMSDMNLAKQ